MRAWLCTLALVVSADAWADCPKCECIAELGLLPRHVVPTDVALNARVITGYVPDPARSERFVLRAVGGAPVAVNAEKLHVDSYDTLVLTPTAPLAKNTDYELVLLRGENTIAYSKLHTSDGLDTTAPTWGGELSAEYVPADGCSIECNDRRGARVEITAAVPADDRSGAELVSVWVTAGGPINYSKAVTARVVVVADDGGSFGGLAPDTGPHVKLLIGGGGPCEKQSIPLPRGTKRVRVGMKVMDRAGNMSAPRELEVRLAVAKKPSH